MAVLPRDGAGLSLAALLAALVAPLSGGGFWGQPSRRMRAVAALAVLIALDDVVSHALGGWTPLDWFWTVVIYPVVG